MSRQFTNAQELSDWLDSQGNSSDGDIDYSFVAKAKSISNLPAASEFGVGVVQMADTGIVYCSNGSYWKELQPNNSVENQIKTNAVLSKYIAAVVANASTVSANTIEALKDPLSNLVASSVWPKLLELWVPPLDGGIAAATVKIKTAPGIAAAMTNTAFVDGDLSAYQGLKSDGATKKLATGFTAAPYINEWGFGVYETTATDSGGILAGDGTNNYIAFASTSFSKINNVAVAHSHRPRLLSVQTSATTGKATSHIGGYTKDTQTASNGAANPIVLFAHNAGQLTNAALGGYAAWQGVLSSYELNLLQDFFDMVTFAMGRTVRIPSACFCGDSNTAGVGVTGAQRWSTLLANHLGMAERNAGKNGSAMSSTATSNAGGSVATKWYSTDISTETTYGDSLLFVMLGTNDDQFNSNETSFLSEYDAWVAAQIAIGWNPRNIMLIAPPYAASIYAHPDKLLRLGSCVTTISQKYGTKFLDAYPVINQAGMLQADNLHLSVNGHIALKNAILAEL
jgi:lysophospholipase L1-like esterase